MTTERLIIRHLVETDLADFLAYQTHPGVLTFLPGEPTSEKRAVPFLAKQPTGEVGEQGGYQAFTVCHRADTRVVGEVGIYIEPEPQSKGDFGWILHRNHQGQGFATEAACRSR